MKRIIGELLCCFGIHEPDGDWILVWYTKRLQCKCIRCGERFYDGEFKQPQKVKSKW